MRLKPIRWKFQPNNPVIRPGQINGDFDARVAGAATVLRLGDTYRMFYWGSGTYPNCICVAESPIDPPNQWRSLGCLITPEPEKEYNVNGPRWPWVLAVDEKTIFLYYCTRSDPAKHPFPNHYWLLISEDGGYTWQEVLASPLLKKEKSYEQEAFGSFCVVKVGQKFHMYYTAIAGYIKRPIDVETHHDDPLPPALVSSGQRRPQVNVGTPNDDLLPLIGIGLATSDDGIRWEKPYDHFLVGPRFFATEPYEYKVAKPCVIQDGNIWRMWVSCLGRYYRVCSLASRDAIHWHWQPSEVEGDFGRGALGSFDDRQRCYATVIKQDDEYRCWYTGNGFGVTGMGYATGTVEVGE